MLDLSGKVALVTGATGAIGGAISRTLRDMGASLAISGTKMESLQKLAVELSEKVETFPCDLAIAEAVDKLVPSVEEVFGKIDILINNAGINQDGFLIRMKDAAWNDVIKVNLEVPFKLMRAAVKSMMRSKWGRIVNISSIVGACGNAGQANYAASKSGLFGLSKTVALEFATRNITVNCVAPGFIASKMTDNIPQAQREVLESRIPMGRVGTPEEVASVVGFLVSEEASYITGQVLHVNGGMAMI